MSESDWTDPDKWDHVVDSGSKLVYLTVEGRTESYTADMARGIRAALDQAIDKVDEQDGQMSAEKSLAEVYEDRNALALAYAALVNRHHEALRDLGYSEIARDYRAMWKPDDGDDADAAEWAILYAITPQSQVSWHIPRSLAEQADLPQKYVRWDGHTRAQKNDRLRSLAGVN